VYLAAISPAIRQAALRQKTQLSGRIGCVRGFTQQGSNKQKASASTGKGGWDCQKKTHPKQKAKNEEDKILEILER
jgi:hypothetical protein